MANSKRKVGPEQKALQKKIENTSEDENEERENKASSSLSASPPQSSSSLVRLKKELGVLEGVGVILGIVVGSGIFVSPKGVIQYSGSVGMALLIWVIGGVFSMVGAFCFAELGTMIPESGGMYAYLDLAFGPVMSFLYMWVTTLTRYAAGTGVICLTFGKYLSHLIMPSCSVIYPHLPVIFALALVFFLTYVNCKRVRWVTRLQNFFTFTKIGALATIIIVGLVHLAKGHTTNLSHPFANTAWDSASLSTAFYHCIFSYTGWDSLNMVTEELKNPNKNLPLAIVLSTSLITVVYTLTNLAYVTVLTIPEIVASDAVVMTFASRMLGMAAWIMPLFIVLTTFGSTNSIIFAISRLTFVGARRGHFPITCSLVSITNHTPVPAVLFNGFLITIMVLVPDMSLLINYTAFSATSMQLAVLCTLFWFRYKHPEWRRPFKVWLFVPLLFSCCLLFLVVVPIIKMPYDVLGAVLLTLAGLPIYYFTIYRKDLARCFGLTDKITVFCQKLFLCMPEEKCD